MTTTINASTSTGLVQTADTSGIIKLQSNGVTTNALAWVNFNASSGSSAVVRASYNVSSVTYNSTGYYTVNFTNATSDINYTVSVNNSLQYATATSGAAQLFTDTSANEVAPLTTAFRFFIRTTANAAFDPKYILATVFGN